VQVKTGDNFDDELDININFNRYNSLFYLLNDIRGICFDTHKRVNINIDCNWTHYIPNECYLVLVTLVNELRSLNIDVKISIDVESNSDFIRYASRINFFKQIGIDFVESFNRHSTKNSLIEISELKGYGFSEELTTLIEKNIKMSDSDSYSLFVALGELSTNIEIHSKANKPYFICQKYENRIDFMFADAGIGVRRSLNIAYPNYSNEDAVKECIKWQVGNGRGRGEGLTVVSEIARRFEGEFLLLSGGNYIQIKNGNESLSTNSNWRGTLVKCRYYLKDQLNINLIYKDYGK